MLRAPLRRSLAATSTRTTSTSLRLRTIGTFPSNATLTPPPPPPGTMTSMPPSPSPAPAPKPKAKAKGDISSIFPSLSSKTAPPPLPPRFAAIKAALLKHSTPAQLQASWDRLLVELETEIAIIAAKGPAVVPTVQFAELEDAKRDEVFLAEVRKRGAVVVRGVVSEEEALEMKAATRRYIKANEGRVKAFPPTNPSVYEIYWSPAQIRARTHPHLLTTQRFLLSTLFSPPAPGTPDDGIDLTTPLAYADRLRIRPPGDLAFALGPHIDAGSVERWEDPTYASAYSPIWSGAWESYSPFSRAGLRARERANLDMYNGAGACSMLRAWQGWLALSRTAPGEGTLRVYPLLKHSTAYFLLRPFFAPEGDKWTLQTPPTPSLPGSVPGYTQELRPLTHPHLCLPRGMTSIPAVHPGDYAAWHGDLIHAVEDVHGGGGDSSVFYIPAAPWSRRNWEFVGGGQRAAMEGGGVPPDFPGAGGEGGEEGWVGRGGWGDVHPEGERGALGWGGREGDV